MLQSSFQRVAGCLRRAAVRPATITSRIAKPTTPALLSTNGSAAMRWISNASVGAGAPSVVQAKAIRTVQLPRIAPNGLLTSAAFSTLSRSAAAAATNASATASADLIAIPLPSFLHRRFTQTAVDFLSKANPSLLRRSFTSRMMSASSSVQDLWRVFAAQPKGFKNFFPKRSEEEETATEKGKEKEAEKENDKAKDEKPTKSDENESKDKKKDSDGESDGDKKSDAKSDKKSGGLGGGPDVSPWSLLLGSAVVALMIVSSILPR